MKTIYELRKSNFTLPIEKISYRVKSLMRKKIDFDVFLPSKGYNLQREFVWTLEQERELIWSILLERNIPSLALIEKIDDTIEVIDGKQRLFACKRFYQNITTLEVEGKEYTFKELPEDWQVAIETHHFACVVAYEGVNKIPDDQKIEWFKRINFAGTPQDVEHLKKLNTSYK